MGLHKIGTNVMHMLIRQAVLLVRSADVPGNQLSHLERRQRLSHDVSMAVLRHIGASAAW